MAMVTKRFEMTTNEAVMVLSALREARIKSGMQLHGSLSSMTVTRVIANLARFVEDSFTEQIV